MKNKELEKFMKDIIETQIETDKFWVELFQFLDLSPDSKLFNKMYSPIEKSVDYIDSELAKYNAIDSWMEYFVYENDCGKNKFTVNVPVDGGNDKIYILDSVDSFISFLEMEYGV